MTSSPDRLAGACCLLLPGVGAFAAVRGSLRGPLEDALRAALGAGAWLLGICVGFQVLFDEGEEFGTTDGLGLLPGRVTRLPDGVPLPHIGWNRLHDLADHPLLAGLGLPAVSQKRSEAESGSAQASRPLEMTDPSDLPIHRSPAGEGPHVYFVHSFAPEAVPAGLRLASATHGRTFPAVAARGRVLGTQFHPERSGEAGLRLLGNYLRLAGGL